MPAAGPRQAEFQKVRLAQEGTQHGGRTRSVPRFTQILQDPESREEIRESLRFTDAGIDVAEGPARLTEEEELLVAEPEEGRPEYRDERHRIVGILDGPESRCHIPDFLPRIVELAPLYDVWYPLAPQRLLIEIDAGRSRINDGDVPVGQRNRLFRRLVEHDPFPGDQTVYHPADRLGLHAAYIGDVPFTLLELRIEIDYGGPRSIPRRRYRFVAGLIPSLLGRFDDTRKGRVYPVDDRRNGTEILGDGYSRPAPGELLLDLFVYLDVGPPEPVDTLLGIAHDEEPARFAAREQKDDLRLERIRVLKLVHEDETESLAERAEQIAVSEEPARPYQQIVEIEEAFLSLRVLHRIYEFIEPIGEPVAQPVHDRGAEIRAALANGLYDPFHLVARFGARPVAPTARVLSRHRHIDQEIFQFLAGQPSGPLEIVENHHDALVGFVPLVRAMFRREGFESSGVLLEVPHERIGRRNAIL